MATQRKRQKPPAATAPNAATEGESTALIELTPGRELPSNWSANNRQVIRDIYKRKFEASKYKEEIESRISRLIIGQRDLEWNNRRQMTEDERFYEGLLTMDDTVARDQPNLRDLKLNIIRKSVNFLSGLAKGRATTGHVTATGVGAYGGDEMKRMIVEEFQRRLGVTQKNSKWRHQRNKRIDDACRAGAGYLHTYAMPSAETGGVIIKCESPHWRNVYYDTGTRDMDDAEYAFILSRRDTKRLKARYEKQAQDIENLSDEYVQVVPAGADYYESIGTGHLFAKHNDITGDFFRRQTTFGHGYYRDTVQAGGTSRDIMVYCKFVCSENFDKVKIVGRPMVMGFARPPLVPLYHSRYSESGLPYTHLVRDRRGIARTMNAMLRNWQRLISSRGAVVNVTAMPKGLDEDTLLRGITARLERPTFVLPEYGPINSTRIENFGADVQKLSNAIGMLMNLSKDTSEVHAALAASEGQMDTAEMMRMMKNDAAVAVTEFNDAADMAAQSDAEIMLSYIEQYNGYLNFGWTSEGARVISLGSDGDTTIEGNKAYYTIEQSNRDELIQKTHQDIIQALISKLDGQIALPLYALFIRTLNLPDGEKMLADLKALSMESGLPVLPSLLDETEQQAMAQEKQKQGELQMQQIMLEMQKLESDIKKNNAVSFAAETKALNPASKVEAELRDTIKRQADSIQEMTDTVAAMHEWARRNGIQLPNAPQGLPQQPPGV